MFEDIRKEWNFSEQVIMGYRNAMTALASGVTTLRDCGAENNAVADIRSAILHQYINGPDILTAGAPLTCVGGHTYYLGGEVSGPWEIRKKIREQQKAGADFVKIMGCFGGTTGVTRTLTFSDEEFMAAIDEARLRDMKVAVHCCTYETTKKMVGFGVDTIEHTNLCDTDSLINYYDEELIEEIKEKNIYCNHTICCAKGSIEMFGALVKAGTATPYEHQRYIDYVNYDKLVVDGFKFQAERGVPYIVATDAGWKAASFKSSVAECLDVMAKNGANVMELIHAATLRNAMALGIDKKIGSVEAGKQADILLLKNDPGVDIAKAVSEPDVVIKKGKVVQKFVD